MSLSKSRTTGAPKPKKTASGRNFKPRSQRESEVNRLVLILSAVILGLIALILGVALLIDGVIIPNQAVAQVGGQSITTREFQARVRFERWRLGQQVAQIAQVAPSLLTNPQAQPYYGWYQDLQFSTSMGQRVLDEMVDTKLIAQYAAANGITVSDTEIDEEMFKYFGFEANPVTPTITPSPTITLTPLVSATPSPTPTITPTATPLAITNTPTVEPTMTPSPFPTGLPTNTPELATRRAEYDENSKNYYDTAAKAVGISQADMRQIFIEQALRVKVRKAIGGEPPKEEEQANVRTILVTTREEADDVLKALQTGASFADLARSVSKDASTGSQGGELGWDGKGQRTETYGTDFEDAVWNAKAGDVVGPIVVDGVKNPTAQPGFHVLQVLAKEVRPLTPEQAESRIDKAFEDWLKTERETKVQRSNEWIDRVPDDPTLADMGIPSAAELAGQ